MVNTVVLVGRLGHAPSLKTTQTGKQQCTFSLATTTGYGERKQSQWHKILAWEKTAEMCKKYLDKGSLVCVEGRIQYNEYEKDGQKKTDTQIVAEKVVFLSRPTGQAQDDNMPVEVENDDIPF